MRRGWFRGSTCTAVPTRRRRVRLAMALATCREAEITERVGVKWISPSQTQSMPSPSARSARSKTSRKASAWLAPWRISSTKSPTCMGRLYLGPGQLELGGPVAGHEAGRRDLLPGRRRRAADVDGVGAARVEVAAARRRGGIGHLALQHEALGARARIGLRHGGEERRGVGVLGGLEERLGLRELDQ